MSSRNTLQFQQNPAHRFVAIVEGFAGLCASCQRSYTHRWGPCPFAYCLVRDPHSCRSVPAVAQPASFFAGLAKKCRNLSIALVVPAARVNSLIIAIIAKGTKTCLRKHGSSQQQPHSVWQVVWKQICSVAPLVRPLARSPQTRLAPTKQRQRWLVLLQACCVTTPASAAPHAKTSRAHAARLTDMNSRLGSTLAAVLRSKDPRHV